MLLASLLLGVYSVSIAYASPVRADPNRDNISLIEKLLLAPTAVDRLALFEKDQDFVYDFNNPPESAITQGDGGHTVKADRKVFPALIGNNIGMTVGFIEPCGFNTPHVHPRSAEINIIVKGRLGTEFIAENGARAVTNYLGQYEMTVFPQGATHTEFNPDCSPAVFVAGFASEDPGVEQSAQTFFNLRHGLVEAALGVGGFINGQSIEKFNESIPANVANGVKSCLQKCKISTK